MIEWVQDNFNGSLFSPSLPLSFIHFSISKASTRGCRENRDVRNDNRRSNKKQMLESGFFFGSLIDVYSDVHRDVVAMFQNKIIAEYLVMKVKPRIERGLVHETKVLKY